MNIKSELLFLIFLLFSPLSAYSADSLNVDYYAPQNIYRFAEYLYNDGDYGAAAGEYLRYLHYLDNTFEDSDRILYRIGQCYQRAGDYDKSIRYYENVIDLKHTDAYFDLAHFGISISLYSKHAFDNSLDYINAKRDSISDTDIRLKMRVLFGIDYLNLKQWRNAFDLSESLSGAAPDDSLNRWFGEVATESLSLPHKSPFAAGLLSSMLPGMGKVYTGRPFDGVYSLIVIGLLTWQAYDGFHDNGTSSTRGWIYGTISGVFYLGNIYGSVVSANIHNRIAEERFLDRVNAEFRFYLF
jgi:tetratricopeptide (TPR) repeat protein